VTHEAELAVDYSSPQQARRVEQSIRPEVNDIDDDRSQTQLDRDGHTVALTVEASDLVALRASLNTWLSLVSVAERAGAC
jgi:KEOPS complex subunit Pcc1